MRYPKILISFPTSDRKDYCVDDFVNQIKGFTYPLYDIFVLENSKDPQKVKEWWKRGIKAVHEPIKGNFREELTRHQNIIRSFFLNGDYDYLLMIESDVFTGECIIENLVSYAEAYRASIVTATYEIQQDEAKLCLTSTVDGLAVRSEKILPRELGYSIMGRGCVPLQKLIKDPDARLTATGIGCTLFGREVLEDNKFRVDLELNAGAFSDTFIFSDALRQGYEVLINSDLICEHRK